MPGLWPALTLNANATSEQASAAHQIYVLQRLPHHLAPQKFPETLVFKMLLLWAAFVVLWQIAPRDPPWRRLAAIVLGAVVIAVVGWLLERSHRVLAAAVRVADALLLVPLDRCPAAAGRFSGHPALHCLAVRLEPARARGWLGVAGGIALLHVGGYAVDRPFPTRPRADKENKVTDYVAWRHVCNWARRNTPSDALFLTPRAPQSFRWYSGRGEVVNYKDLPQDAVSMLQWRDRMQAVHGAPRRTACRRANGSSPSRNARPSNCATWADNSMLPTCSPNRRRPSTCPACIATTSTPCMA